MHDEIAIIANHPTSAGAISRIDVFSNIRFIKIIEIVVRCFAFKSDAQIPFRYFAPICFDTFPFHGGKDSIDTSFRTNVERVLNFQIAIVNIWCQVQTLLKRFGGRIVVSKIS